MDGYVAVSAQHCDSGLLQTVGFLGVARQQKTAIAIGQAKQQRVVIARAGCSFF